MSEIRLQKFMADCGVASRRKCEEYILKGLVRVNGEIVNKLGIKVATDKDIVEYNGKKIQNVNNKKVYILLNKPIGYVTTVKEQFGRPTVMELVKNVKERVVPVGRLDMYTSGAIILTNDGDFVYKVTHPKYEIEKTYIVTLRGKVLPEEIEKLKNGVKIDDYVSGKAKVKVIKYDVDKNESRLEIIIHEGKNREVRKMCEAIGKKVLALHRTKIGNIEVKPLELGKYRFLTAKEVESLIKYVNIPYN